MSHERNDTLLVCEAITKTFDRAQQRGVRNVSFEVRSREVFALLGKNGAGKTTLLNVCMGFIRPDRGRVFVDHVNVNSRPVVARMLVAYIPEVARLYDHLSAIENAAFFESLMGRRTSQRSIEEALDQLGFPIEYSRTPLGTYSKGMRQKVVIALGMLKGAKVFLFDEPTSGLDPAAQEDFRYLLTQLREKNAAVVLATHDIHAISDMATRVGLLSSGELTLNEPVGAHERAVQAHFSKGSQSRAL